MNYPNLYYSLKSSHEFIDPSIAETNSSAIAGFTTSMKTRPLIIAKLEEFIRNKSLKINSNRLLDEIRTFVWMHGKPQAMRGYNDDLIMSLAIACWVRDTALMANKRSEQYNKACLDAMIMTNTKISTKIPGQNGYNKKLDIDANLKKGNERDNYIKYSWLFKG